MDLVTDRPRTLLDAIVARFRESFGDEFLLDEPLSRHTSSGLGGPADVFVTVRSVEGLVEAATLAARQAIPFWVLGAGSNVLVSDAGIRGLVIRNRAQGVTFRHDGLGVIAQAESGASLSALVRQCASRGLAGLAWAAGIPGTVGGAVVGNAGAHGSDVASSLRMVRILDADFQARDYEAEQMGFCYRDSALRQGHTGQGHSSRVVLETEFQLRPGSAGEVEAEVARIMTDRKQTQPAGASMGCMFKNPPGDSAGRLMDQAGLKSLRIGGVQVSPIHANFFVATEGATAEEVKKLMAESWYRVRDHCDVELEPEVELIGDWD